MPTNDTDYDFPETWGLMSDKQKSDWFLRERVFRQARRQDTTFGNRYQQAMEEQQRLDTGSFKIDDDEPLK